MSLLGLRDTEAEVHVLRLLRQLPADRRSAVIKYAEALNEGASLKTALIAHGRATIPDDEERAEAWANVRPCLNGSHRCGRGS